MIRTLSLLLAAAFMVASAAQAHSWYPWQCCHDQDCRPVKCEDLTETKDGYEDDGVKFSKSMEQPSKDRMCHVCIMGDGAGRHGMCVFTLQGT